MSRLTELPNTSHFLPPCQAVKSRPTWWSHPVLRNSTANYQAQQHFEIMHWSVKTRVRILLFQTDFDLSHPQNLIDCYSGEFPLTQAVIKALNHCRVSEWFHLQTEPRKIWNPAPGQGEVTRQNLVLRPCPREGLALTSCSAYKDVQVVIKSYVSRRNCF